MLYYLFVVDGCDVYSYPKDCFNGFGAIAGTFESIQTGQENDVQLNKKRQGINSAADLILVLYCTFYLKCITSGFLPGCVQNTKVYDYDEA